MAQLNITLNQEEILQLLAQDRDEAFKSLLEAALNSILQAESEEQLKAKPYERNKERTDSRNGSRERALKTRIGQIILTVPRHRNKPFKTLLFENYTRSEASLISTMAEMVVSGVSTRKVSKVIETLCGTGVSKSSVSEACKELDAEVDAFKNRELCCNYPFLSVDATYFKVRENHRIVSKALMIARATNEYGMPEIIGIAVYPRETKETWQDFFKKLKKRGLHGVIMLTSDAHEGIIQAARQEFPDVPWQRCQFHFSKNISEKVPKNYQAGLRTELTEMFNSETIEEARQKRDEIISDYMDVAETAMRCLDEGFESAMTVMTIPKVYRRLFRTTNHLERLNKELKRRSNVIGVFPNEASLIRLMGTVLLEKNIQMTTSTHTLFSKRGYKELTGLNVTRKLLIIAKEQEALLVA